MTMLVSRSVIENVIRNRGNEREHRCIVVTLLLESCLGHLVTNPFSDLETREHSTRRTDRDPDRSRRDARCVKTAILVRIFIGYAAMAPTL